MKRRQFLQRMAGVATAVAAGIPLLQRWVVVLPAGRYPADAVNRAVALTRGMHLENAVYLAERNEFVLRQAMMGWLK